MNAYQRNEYFKNFVRDNLLSSDIYLALAEEASELSKAAAKQARILIGNNPSPVSEKENENNVVEEFSDVCLCFEVLFGSTKDNEMGDICKRKLSRWVNRLSDGHNVVVTGTSSTWTGYKDATGQNIYTDDVLYGSSDNKAWTVVGVSSETKPYVLTVQDSNGTTKQVKPMWMSHDMWNFDHVTVDNVKYVCGRQYYLGNLFVPVTLVSSCGRYACVIPKYFGKPVVVKTEKLSYQYNDSFETVASDLHKYTYAPDQYCHKYAIDTDKKDFLNSMLSHVSERLKRL